MIKNLISDIDRYSKALEFYYKGEKYEKGSGYYTKNLKLAFKFYLLSAQIGFPIAQYRVGVLYESGFGVKMDFKKAFEWYKKSANQGYNKAQYSLAICYYRQLEMEDGMYSGTQLGEKNREALYKWTIKLVKEEGFYDFIYSWYLGPHMFSKLAKKENPEAQNNLAFIYLKGIKVPKDYTTAYTWFLRSALNGFSEAYYNLGIMCKNGLGTKKDIEKAMEYVILSAKQGNAKAQNYLGEIGGLSDVSPTELFEKSAKQGNAKALYNLGQRYEYGKGVKKDLIRALNFYYLSAIKGNGQAQNEIGKIYEKKGFNANGMQVKMKDYFAPYWRLLSATFGNNPKAKNYFQEKIYDNLEQFTFDSRTEPRNILFQEKLSKENSISSTTNNNSSMQYDCRRIFNEHMESEKITKLFM